MTQFRKSFLGPARSVACDSCGRKVSVHWLGLSIIIPLLVGIFLKPILLPAWYAYLPLAAGIVATFAMQAFLIPLVPRD